VAHGLRRGPLDDLGGGGLSYESPHGTVELRDRHLQQRVFLAAAHGLSWDVIRQL